jgi:AraC family transcriptional regulator
VTRCRWTWGDGWNETATRRAGDIGLTPPQSGGTFEVDGDHEILVIGFSLKGLAARGLIEDKGPRPFGRLHDAYHRDATGFAMCRQLWRLAKGTGDAASMAGDAIAAELVGRWRSMAEQAPAVPRPVRPLDDRVFAAIRLRVAESPGASHRLEEWAALAGMTAAAFSRAFAARAGMPPHRYLLECRIRMAEQLLSKPGSDVEAIADALGFDSRSHFSRVYARLRGRTPRG